MAPRNVAIGRGFAAVLLGGVLTLTACGSDDSADATPAAEESAAAAAAAAAAAITTAAAGDASGNDEFCTTLAEYVQSPDEGVESDPADMAQLASIAPQEIAADFQDLADMTAQIVAFDEMTASEDEIAEFGAVVEEFDTVSARLEAWTTENCPNVELG